MALGHTVGELQQKISWAEYVMWMEYRIKNGSLSPIRKYDMPAAIVAAALNNTFGGKASVGDFMFHGKSEKGAPEGVTLDAFVKTLGGVKVGQRKRR